MPEDADNEVSAGYELPEWVARAIEFDPVPTSMVVASFVRDALEDFHAAHLSDTQMAELNPLIRQGICDALTMLEVAADDCDDRVNAARLVIALKAPPQYWEEPDQQQSLRALADARAYLRRWAARNVASDD